MADKITEDELKAERTEGFKVGEKKTLDEYLKLGMLTKSILHVLALRRLHKNFSDDSSLDLTSPFSANFLQLSPLKFPICLDRSFAYS
jgi:hypothetical protein